MGTPKDVALAMYEVIRAEGELTHGDAVLLLERLSGQAFVYDNEAGNQAIDTRVLAEFRKLTGEEYVWSRSDLCWRQRTRDDPIGRRQVD